MYVHVDKNIRQTSGKLIIVCVVVLLIQSSMLYSI